MRTVHRCWIAPTLLATAALPAAAQQQVAVPEKPRLIASEPAELFRVGAEEGESWELLSNVRSLAFDAQDNLYVLDAGNFRVLVFDRNGEFVRQIGKQGEGPGEITFALGMIVDAKGDVVVYDMGRGGFTVYGRDGSYKTTITGAQDSRLLGGSGLQAVPGGGIAMRTTTALRAGPGQPFSPPTGPTKAPIVVHPLTENGEVRTLYEIEMPPPKVVESGNANNRRVMVSISPPVFSPSVGWGVLPTGGIALNTGDAYAVQVLDGNGRVQRVFSTGAKPRPVSNRDREQARDQRREAMRNPGGGPGISVRNVNGQTSYSFSGPGGGGSPPSSAQIEEAVRGMEFAETVPLVRGLFTDRTGRIWVTRTSDENPTQDGVIDLLDHAGRYIGSLRDEAVPAAVSASGLAAYITRDELDIEQIVVKRLPSDWK